jgi:hypothetical protein
MIAQFMTAGVLLACHFDHRGKSCNSETLRFLVDVLLEMTRSMNFQISHLININEDKKQ